MTFLILRCKTSDTLRQLDNLRAHATLLGIEPQDIRCPTCRVERRLGRQRARVEVDVPVLGNFLFVRWDETVYWANYLEHQFPFVSVMRLPQGGYASCSEEEVDAINTIPRFVPYDAPRVVFEIGQIVEVKKGFFLHGFVGRVIRSKKNGEVTLKVLNGRNWKMNTLLIHSSLLIISSNASELGQSGTSV